MEWIIAIVIAVFGVSVVTGLHAAQKKPEVVKTPQEKPMKRMNSEEILSQLKMLAMKKPPKDLATIGAMCYKVAMPPERVDYICPKDGSKTLYKQQYVHFIQYDLPRIRALAENMPSVTVTIDESEFCKKCSPKVTNPQIIMTVHYTDRTHTVKGITDRDLQLMHDFLSGKDRFTNEYDAETPLKDYIPRLEELLGVKLQ